MSLLSPLLLGMILTAGPAAPNELPGVVVHACDFDASNDKNFDTWPDGWVRRSGRGFPAWIDARIVEDRSPDNKRSLRIDLKGGAVAVHGPPVPIDVAYDYVLEARIQAEGMRADRFQLSLSFMDEQKGLLERFSSDALSNTPWRSIRIGPVRPRDKRARMVVFGLSVTPDRLPDLDGTIRVAGIRVRRVPRLTLTVDDGLHLIEASQARSVSVALEASGLALTEPSDSPSGTFGRKVVFALTDVHGKEVARHETALTSSRDYVASDAEPGSLLQNGTHTSAGWEFQLEGTGFYRVTAHLPGPPPVQREVSLAVYEAYPSSAESPFGWSLPEGAGPLDLEQLAGLIRASGVRRIKFPLWLDEANEPESSEAIVGFVEKLDRRGVRIVGLLHDPPQSVRDQLPRWKGDFSAELFAAESQRWLATLEPSLARLAVAVRQWQLGRDEDHGFVRHPGLAEFIARVRQQMNNAGSDASLGMGWGWLDAFPTAEDPDASPSATPVPWHFLALSAEPPLAATELERHLQATDQAGVDRFLVLRPLPPDSYSRTTRVTDLVERMMAAVRFQAEGVFVSDVFDDRVGLLQSDGTPGELYLPWRTVALLLGGSQYAGQIDLPGETTNHIFVRDELAVLVLKNPRTTLVPVNLGPNARQIDPWGTPVKPEPGMTPSENGPAGLALSGDAPARPWFVASPLPTLVVGVDRRLIAWRQQVALEPVMLPADFERPQTFTLSLSNPFDHVLLGQLEVVAPNSWEIEPKQRAIRLAVGETLEVPLSLRLLPDAATGVGWLRFDFKLDVGDIHELSVHRELEIGGGGIKLEVTSRVNERGYLEVRQRLLNETDGPVSFRCHLHAPGNPRQQRLLLRIPPGENTQTYHLPDGRSLQGQQLWLRAEQIDGARILNHRFEAK